MTDRTVSSNPRRVRPAVRWLAIVSVIVLTPLAAHAIWDHVELRRLTWEIQAIQAKGEPVTLQQAGRGYRELTADQATASRYYLAAAALGDEFDPKDRAVLRSAHEWLAGALPAQPDFEQTERDLSSAITVLTEPLRLVDVANQHEFNGFGAGSDYNFRAAQMAKLSAILALRTMQRSLANRGDEAAQSALGALRFRRAIRDAGWFVLGGHEIPAVLSFSSPSDDSLIRLQSALESEEKAYDLANELAAERAAHLDVVWRRYYGTDPRAPHQRSLPLRSLQESFWRPWFTHSMVATLRQWAELVEAARKPWPETSAAVAAVFQKYPTSDEPPRFSFLRPRGLMAAAFWSSATLPSARSGTFITDRCTRTALAIERFRRAHQGKLPASLTELVPRYLQDVPVDPNGDGPLRLKTDSASYTVYSVGSDRKDDGGDLISELQQVKERGWGRPTIRGRDVGVRVLLR